MRTKNYTKAQWQHAIFPPRLCHCSVFLKLSWTTRLQFKLNDIRRADKNSHPTVSSRMISFLLLCARIFSNRYCNTMLCSVWRKLWLEKQITWDSPKFLCKFGIVWNYRRVNSPTLSTKKIYPWCFLKQTKTTHQLWNYWSLYSTETASAGGKMLSILVSFQKQSPVKNRVRKR